MVILKCKEPLLNYLPKADFRENTVPWKMSPSVDVGVLSPSVVTGGGGGRHDGISRDISCCLSILPGIDCEKTNWKRRFEPSHEIMFVFILRKLILQTRMRSHPVWLDVWFFFGPFEECFQTSCERTAKALVLARVRGCAGLPELSVVADKYQNLMSWPFECRVYERTKELHRK